jgi:galactokinase
MQQKVVVEFEKRFGGHPALVVRAPGRVNLIGEHTDYNDGFVLPMAIDRAIWIAVEPKAGAEIEAYSMDYDRSAIINLDRLERGRHDWIEYVKGVAWALREAGYPLEGWRGVIAGNVPVGAGLSSSAALETAVAQVFASLAGKTIPAGEMAKLCQKAENKWVGVNCGIMDQLISAAGKEGNALLIDCRSLDLKPCPLPEGTSVVVLDTATRRGLEGSAYNERRAQCEAAAKFFGVTHLRDVTLEHFKQREAELEDLPRRRARHVISENERTVLAAKVMAQGDAKRLGELMDQSHVSLRDDFEVSSNELNIMVEIARKQPGCFGARMTGAGFGGCAMALIDQAVAEAFVQAVVTEYNKVTGLEPNVYVCQATDGVRVVEGELAGER